MTVRHTKKGPNGEAGWEVTIKNLLADTVPDNGGRAFPPDFPDEDLRGEPLTGQPMGFVATLRLGRGGKNDEHLYTKALLEHGEERRWFIPEGMKAEGPEGTTVAEPGTPLVIGTRGMGFYLSLPLPKAGKEARASAAEPAPYRLRPDQVVHANLTHAFSARLRDVEDPPPCQDRIGDGVAAPPKRPARRSAPARQRRPAGSPRDRVQRRPRANGGAAPEGAQARSAERDRLGELGRELLLAQAARGRSGNAAGALSNVLLGSILDRQRPAARRQRSAQEIVAEAIEQAKKDLEPEWGPFPDVPRR